MTTPSPSAFDPQAFEGTAEYYAVGRPPYSAQLADTMVRELSLDGTGQLLDVGCGPGVLELPLARLFDQVTALDPEPGMLQAGQRRCQQAEWPTCAGCGGRGRYRSAEPRPAASGHLRTVVSPDPAAGGCRGRL